MKNKVLQAFAGAAGLSMALMVAGSAMAQSGDNRFFDGFNGSSIDRSRWDSARFPQGRGWYESFPSTRDGVVHMSVARYNSNRDHGGFRQADLRTKETFKPGSRRAVKAQARIRLRHNQRGIVHGFYFYNQFGDDGNGNAARSDEIDFEFLTNLTSNKDRPKILLSTWKNWDRADPVYGGASNGGFHQSLESTSRRRATDWNWYEMFWQEGKIIFHRADGGKKNWQWLRTYTGNDKVPTRAMRLHLNSWVADDSWTEAYAGGLQPTGRRSEQAYYSMHVDQISVVETKRR